MSPSAYPLGGLAIWLKYLLAGLRRAGWETKLGLLDGVHHDSLEYVARHPEPDWVSIRNPTGSKEGRVRVLAKTISKFNPNIVLVVNVPDAYMAAGRLKFSRERRDIKFLMSLHQLEPEYFEDIVYYSDVIDGIVVTNKVTQQAICALTTFDSSRIFYAPCGVNVPDTLPVEPISKGLELLYVGRLYDEEKRIRDIPLILKALTSRGIEFTLKVAGSGPDRGQLLSSLAPWGDRIQYLGPLTQERLSAEVYQPGSVLLVTSERETGPLVVWEAMAHGVAVVTSRYCGSVIEGSLINNENCLVFEIGDALSAARQIDRIRDPEIRRSITDKAFRLVKKRYDQRASISSWINALDSTMKLPLPESTHRRHTIRSSGRLDEWLGVSIAEYVRRILGIKFLHSGPGGEWPHSHGYRSSREKFQELIKELERRCH